MLLVIEQPEKQHASSQIILVRFEAVIKQKRLIWSHNLKGRRGHVFASHFSVSPTFDGGAYPLSVAASRSLPPKDASYQLRLS